MLEPTTKQAILFAETDVALAQKFREAGFGLHMAEMMIAAEMMCDDMKAAMRKGGNSQIVRAGG